MSLNSFDELQDDAQSDDRTTEAGIPDDVGPARDTDVPILKARPEAMLDVEAIVDFGMNLDEKITDEQNYRGTSGMGGQFIFTLKNPVVQHGDLWVSTDAEENSASYKLVNMDDAAVEEDAERVDGDFEEIGISVNGNTFYAEQAESFEAQLPAEGDRDYSQALDADGDTYVNLFIGGSGGQWLARLLDTWGGPFAKFDSPSSTEDYDSKVDGLFEAPYQYGSDDYSTDDHGYPRVARTPVLRKDMVGEPVRLLWMFGDEYQGNRLIQTAAYKLDEIGSVATYEETGMDVQGIDVLDEDESAGRGEASVGDPKQLQFLDEDAEAQDSPEYGSNLQWHSIEDDLQAQSGGSTEYGGDASADDADETPDDVQEAAEDADFGDDDGSLSYDDLEDGSVAETFVDQSAEMGMGPDDYDDFEAKVADAKEQDGLNDDIDASELASVIENQMEA